MRTNTRKVETKGNQWERKSRTRFLILEKVETKGNQRERKNRSRFLPWSFRHFKVRKYDHWTKKTTTTDNTMVNSLLLRLIGQIFSKEVPKTQRVLLYPRFWAIF